MEFITRKKWNTRCKKRLERKDTGTKETKEPPPPPHRPDPGQISAWIFSRQLHHPGGSCGSKPEAKLIHHVVLSPLDTIYLLICSGFEKGKSTFCFCFFLIFLNIWIVVIVPFWCFVMSCLVKKVLSRWLQCCFCQSSHFEPNRAGMTRNVLDHYLRL